MCGCFEPVSVATGQHNLGAFRPGTSSRLQSDACTAADDHDGLP